MTHPSAGRPRSRGAGRLGRDALKPARPAHAMARQPADLGRDVGRHGCDGVVVVRLEAHHARGLRRPEADGEDRSEHDRHLSEHVPGMRSPSTLSTPSTTRTASMRPSSTANSARSPPSSAAYSPGTRLMSAALRESRSRSAASRAAKTATPPISSAVTTLRHPRSQSPATGPVGAPRTLPARQAGRSTRVSAAMRASRDTAATSSSSPASFTPRTKRSRPSSGAKKSS